MSYPPPPPTPTPSGWPDPGPAPAGLELLDNENIQGNVIAAFNKDHQQFLLLALPADPAAARGWLGALAPRVATNKAVANFNARFSAARHSSGADPEDLVAVWFNVSLTAEGLRRLAPTEMGELEGRGDVDVGIKAWTAGAPSAAAQVGDTGRNDPTTWLFGADPTTVHAIICVAADRPADLAVELQRQRDLAAQHGLTLIFEQAGQTLPGRAAGHEHFGFKDGISQPGVIGFDPPDETVPAQVEGKPGTDLIAAGEFLIGYPRQDRAAVPAPRWMFDGSFLVFRRLAQDVPGFWSGMEQQFATLPDNVTTDPTNPVSGPDALAARMVGRWRSGTPTATSPTVDLRSGRTPGDDNDFDFGDDLDGQRTPACAHIRKVYPRKGAEAATIPVTEEQAEQRRILRRGIPFGLPFSPGNGRGQGVDADRGLLFQCYQASLTDQFIFIQENWVNNADFPNPSTGADPVIGPETDVTLPAAGQTSTVHFQQWVTTQGTVFAFTPSLTTIRSLASGNPLPSS